MSFTNSSSDSYDISGLTLTSTTNGTTTYVPPQTQTVPAGSTIILTFEFTRSSNPPNIQITFTYTATNNTTHVESPSIQISGTLEFPNCPNGSC